MITAAMFLSLCLSQPAPSVPAAPVTDWKAAEAPYLTDFVQLTSRDQFIKAGEAYFNADGSWIIFQATPAPKPGETAATFYAMYVAKITKDAAGNPTGLEQITMVSPPGSANTCGWFHPTRRDTLLFGCTIDTPKDEGKSGFQVGTRKYKWMFPDEMEVCSVRLTLEEKDRSKSSIIPMVHPVFKRPNYDAECSYDSTGRFLLYAHVEDRKEGEKADANIYVYDTKLKTDTVLVHSSGYDGGPFFSPDGQWICYRSDRKGDDLLQLFVAKLKYTMDADGNQVPAGIEDEYQLTDNGAVNWAPYWHPSGKFLIYATSEVDHGNYEIFGIEVDQTQLKAAKIEGRIPKLERKRITQAQGADVLSVFSFDGQWMMWTSQRGEKLPDEAKPSSQLWIARWKGGDTIGSGNPKPAGTRPASQ